MKLKEDLKTIDVTEIITYSKKVENLHEVTRMLAPIYIRDFIMAFDLSSSMLSNVVRYEMVAKNNLDTAESIAYLDKAGDYLKSKDIKDTAEARKRYVDINEEVMEARDVLAQVTALASLLKNKLVMFKAAHDSLKKIIYGDNSNSYEGM